MDHWVFRGADMRIAIVRSGFVMRWANCLLRACALFAVACFLATCFSCSSGSSGSNGQGSSQNPPPTNPPPTNPPPSNPPPTNPPPNNPPPTNPPPTVKYGQVQGGSTPVSGASIQMYAVGTTGDGSGATPLFATPLTTDASGKFDYAGAYTCPTADALVYMVATGGDPSTGTINPQISMMVALGACGSLTPTTNVTINEVTTVAAVWSLAEFMGSANAVGAAPANASALSVAFQMATTLVNPATGIPGANAPSGVPVYETNTFADILAGCVQSKGGVAGDGSACGKLFQYTTPAGAGAPTDVIGAALTMANNPTQNTAELFGLIPSPPPFLPARSAAPPSFGIPAIATGLTVTGSSLSFPAGYVGSTATLQEIVTNSGTSPVALSEIDILGQNALEFGIDTITNGCAASSSLPPAATCRIEISFSPASAGQKAAALQIVSNAPNPLIRIPLSGQGVALTTSAFSITDQNGAPVTSLTFTKAGVPQHLTVTNTGTGVLNIKVNATSTPGTLIQALRTCFSYNTVLNPGGTCSFDVLLNALVPGAGTGSIAVTAMVGTNPVTQTVPVAIPASGVNFSAAPISFGDWGIGTTSTPLTVSVASGDPSQTPAALNGKIVPLEGSTSDLGFAISSESCSVSECKILLTFTPEGAIGGRGATLSTDYGDVQLGGMAINGFSYTVSPYVPVSIPVFSSQSQDLTITNNGNKPLYGLSAGVLIGTNFYNIFDCPSTLNPGQTCINTVVFRPTALGNLSDYLSVGSGTSGLAAKTIPLSGTALTVPPRVLPSSLTFGPSQVGIASAAQTVRIQAPSQDPIKLTAASTEDASGEFTPTLTQCTGSCEVNITFIPSTTGLRKGGIKVTDLGTGLTATIAVQGTGAEPDIAFSPSSLTFSTPFGTISASQMVTVTNNGTVPIGIPAASIAGMNPEEFVIQADTCPTSASLLPGRSCAVSVIFQPLAQGAFSGTLQLSTTDPNNPTLTLNMSGTGLAPVGPPAIVLSPTSLSFPDVYVGGSSPLQGVVATNNSQYAMNVQFSVSGSPGDFVVGNGSICSLQPGKSCRIPVQFTPTAVGARTAMVKAIDTYTGFASSVAVSGNGLALSGGPLVFAPSSVTLAGGGIPQQVTVINGGTSDLTIEKISGVDSTDCGTVLPVNGTCQITVKANSQTASVQNLTASILASSSATPYTLPITVKASGDGTSLSTVPLTFGPVPLGSSAQQTITLNGFKFFPPFNTWVTGPNAADFDSPGNPNCESIDSVVCEATVTFTPQGSGLRTATITSKWGNIDVYGIGGSGDGADFTITPIDFPANIVPGYVGRVKVTNTGTAPLILSGGNDCNVKLEIGASCTDEVYFYGASESQGFGYVDLISLTDRSIQMNGETGSVTTNPPTVNPTQLSFGNVAVDDTSAVQYITVTQADGHPMVISANTPGDFLIDDSACAQATPCQIGVRFHPLSAGYQGTGLNIRDRVTGLSIGANVNGTGGLPQISVSPSSVVFPTQEIGSTWANQVVTVQNTGDATLQMISPALSGADSGDFAIASNGCGIGLIAGGSCSISISFVPHALGERTATLQITSDSTTNSVITLPVSATSTPVP